MRVLDAGLVGGQCPVATVAGPATRRLPLSDRDSATRVVRGMVGALRALDGKPAATLLEGLPGELAQDE